ncbi:MAG: NAD+ synthase, partial [Nitrospirae bacterium CG22_combo_CG10-13_8_21_14_all_44_11]
MKTIRIALAQINPTVGGIEGNVLKICDYIRKAREQNSGVVVFPELAITGYPPEDLLLKQHFIDDNLEALSRVIENTKDIAAVVGFVDRKDNILYNAAAIIRNRKIIGVYHKVFLP